MKRLVTLTTLIILSLIPLTLTTHAQTTAGAYIVNATAQRFQGGLMIYRSDTGTIYLLEDAYSGASGDAYRYSSSEYGEFTDNRLTAPQGFYSPEQGFGRIWANDTPIRNQFQWATLPEIGFQMPVVQDSDGSVYLEQLNGTVYQVTPNNTWRTVNQLPRLTDQDVSAVIESFTIDTTRIEPGDTITVSWEVTGDATAVQLLLYDLADNALTRIAEEDLPLVGTQELTIPVETIGNVRAVLQAINTEPAPGIRGAVSVPRFLAKQEKVLLMNDTTPGIGQVQAAYQPFENGFMLWRADTGTVLTFLRAPEPLPNGYLGGHSRYPERWYADWDDFPGTVPDGFVQPKNAFGKVWNESAGRQQNFGYPTAEEQSYTMTVRKAEGPTTYSLPDGRTVVIDSGGAYWQFQQ